MQFDGFQCGVWVCWAVNLMISATVDRQARTAPHLTNLLNEAVSVNVTSVRVRDGGLRFIQEARVSFVNSIMRAVSAGSLLVQYTEAVAVAPLSALAWARLTHS